MTDRECIGFLQWALPRLGLRWPGFRKVRGQVRKRINGRLEELGLARIADYRGYLESHPGEWSVLGDFTRISISRFYRDRGVFDCLRDDVLPVLVRAVRDARQSLIRCWSAGCASGEEPYTLAILWTRHVQQNYPGVGLHIVATDADAQMLQRAYQATYPASSLKGAPAEWREAAFTRSGQQYVLRPEFRQTIEFCREDIRAEMPAGPFHLILCRNLVFTYFAEDVQRRVLERLLERLIPGSFLVAGKKETLPEGVLSPTPYAAGHGVYRASDPEPQAGSGRAVPGDR